MAYSGVYVFGDSLVDAGNALKLSQTYDYFPFTSLPDGAPTTAKGYYQGRFTDGWTFADLISNKYLSVPTKTVFPFGYDDPYLGISFGFFSDPGGNNLNFAYGGGQIRQGEEAVPDMDDQTDAYRDAVDGDADPNALHMFVFGANDVHDLVPKSNEWEDLSSARQALERAADEFIEEILQTIEIGARHILITGVPDIGIQPFYNGSPDEAARRAIATEYSAMLDAMIQDRLGELQVEGVTITYVDWSNMAGTVLGTMVALHGESEIYPLNLSNEVFVDKVHPSAQLHALAAAYMIDSLNGLPAGEQMPLAAPDLNMSGIIGAKGEVDTITISLAANASYTFDLLGISTLGGNYLTLADPMLRVLGPNGALISFNDDGGLGLDSTLSFTAGVAGDYVIQLSGVGAMTGGYQFQAAAQASGDNSYSVSHANALILEAVGGGFDTVRASVSYALNSGAEIEVLRTANDKGKGAVNLTGNEFGQAIIGNSGSNILEGKAGADVLTGGAGKDIFVLSSAAVMNPDGSQIDRITDYGAGDLIDVSQILSVAAGTNISTGGYLRVTTGGLVQVDLDGGGNNWITLSQINSGGTVSVRYLSGGLLTTASLSRISANSTTVTASSVAAAGMVAVVIDKLSTDVTEADNIAAAATPEMSAGISGEPLGALAGSGQTLAIGAIIEAHYRPASLAMVERNGGEGLDLVGRGFQPSNQIEEAAVAYVGNDNASPQDGAALRPLAMTVAIPSAQWLQSEGDQDGRGVGSLGERLAEVVQDALGKDVDAAINGLLQGLSTDEVTIAEMRADLTIAELAVQVAQSRFAIDQMFQDCPHPDMVQLL